MMRPQCRYSLIIRYYYFISYVGSNFRADFSNIASTHLPGFGDACRMCSYNVIIGLCVRGKMVLRNKYHADVDVALNFDNFSHILYLKQFLKVYRICLCLLHTLIRDASLRYSFEKQRTDVSFSTIFCLFMRFVNI